MLFPNVTFESEQVDFGCILNDTETIRYISMVNSSPLEVRYTWSFLKRPPVQRAPDHDEGVDLESECDTDSLDEETRSRESLEDDEVKPRGESEIDEGDEKEMSTYTRPHGTHIQIADKDEIIGSDEDIVGGSSHGEESAGIRDSSGEVEQETSHGKADEVAPDEIELPEQRPLSPISEEQFQQSQLEMTSVGSRVDEVIESGLPPGVSEIEVVPEVATVDLKSDNADEKSEVAKTRATKKEKRKPQPWELTYDPFTPISIEQVSQHDR